MVQIVETRRPVFRTVDMDSIPEDLLKLFEENPKGNEHLEQYLARVIPGYTEQGVPVASNERQSQ